MTSPTEARRRPLALRSAFVAAILVLLGIGAWLVFGAARDREDVFTGYVVSDNVYMAAPVAGTVAEIAVARGDRVAAGAALFSLDPTALGARADQARAEIGEAAAQQTSAEADLGRAAAALRGAEADVRKARADLARLAGAQREKSGAVPETQIDQARAALVNAVARRDAAGSDVAAGRGRIATARASVEAQRANLAAAHRQVQELAAVAPVAARVEEVMYEPGEWAAANAAIVSLVPDSKVKVRFYVPQAVVGHFRPGTAVALACDGCAAGLTGRVQFVASRPEYTPPVIYSLATRDKLVFMVEALPANPRLLIPGQPMDVRLATATR